MSFSSILLLAGVILVGVFILSFVVAGAQEKAINEAAESLVDRAISKFPSYRGKPVVLGAELILIINEEARTALAASADGTAKEILFDTVQSVEVLEDGNTVSETRKKGTIGRTMVGAAVGGGAGAVVGAMTAGGKTTFREVVTNITIAVKTTDPSFPVMAWCTFAPQIGIENMTAFEINIQRKAAATFAEQVAPIFRSNRAQDQELVAI